MLFEFPAVTMARNAAKAEFAMLLSQSELTEEVVGIVEEYALYFDAIFYDITKLKVTEVKFLHQIHPVPEGSIILGSSRDPG